MRNLVLAAFTVENNGIPVMPNDTSYWQEGNGRPVYMISAKGVQSVPDIADRANEMAAENRKLEGDAEAK